MCTKNGVTKKKRKKIFYLLFPLMQKLFKLKNKTFNFINVHQDGTRKKSQLLKVNIMEDF